MLSVYLPNCPPDIFFDHMCVLVTAEIVVGVGSNVNLGARPYKNMVGGVCDQEPCAVRAFCPLIREFNQNFLLITCMKESKR